MDKIKKYKEYKAAYYNGNPIISDFEFDNFEKKLLIEYPNLRDELIGWEDNSLQKFNHPSQMPSLNKFNIYEELSIAKPYTDIINWLSLNKKYTISPKYDGNAVNVIYKNGKLWKVLSRGNGSEGRDYTNKFLYLPKILNLPKSLLNSKFIEFRGEALIELTVFNKKYSQFKNPRNFVAGLLNQKDFNKEQAKDLIIEFFDVKIDGKVYSETLIDNCNLRTKNSFSRTIIDNSWETFYNTYYKMGEYRKNVNYYLDGFVIKSLENERKQCDIGNPKDCIAIKFPPQESQTVIKDIEWNVGKTGELTPVLIVNPVLLNDTIVKKASAHNIKYVLSNGFIPGATIVISKSGDIIPQARKVVTQSNLKYIIPINCPICGAKLIQNEKHLICNNPNCIAKAQKKLLGIRLLGIENLGSATLNKLYNVGITKIEDFFTSKFTKEYLINTNEFKKGKSLDNLFNEFNKLKVIKLAKIIESLQFTNVGKSISKQYAKKMAYIDYSFKSLDRTAIKNIDEKRILDFINILIKKGIRIEYPTIIKNNKNIIRVEMTGTVDINNAKTKKEFLNLFTNVKQLKLNKETDYLITNDLNAETSKMKKAKQLGIQIITYSDFLIKFENNE